VHVEHALAFSALKMVVVLPHQFEARVLAGQVHRLKLPFLHQRLEVAIDGGDAQPRHRLLRSVQHFLWQQRPLGLCDGIADGSALAGIAFYGCRLPELEHRT